MNPNTQDTWEFVGRKAWDPDWEQVIVFLAGKLAASPHAERHLLELLSDEVKDDVFRHRLGVAALCLDEIPPTARRPLTEQIDQITEAAFSVWSDYLLTPQWLVEHDKGTIVSHLTRGLPSLGRTNGRFQGVPLLDRLAEWLRDEHDDVWATAVAALAAMCGGGIPPIRERVVELMEDWHAQAPARIWDLKARPEFFEWLAGLLRGAMWDLKARPEFLDWLAGRLRDARGSVRYWTAAAVARIGPAAATPAILERIAELLQEKDWQIREQAAKAVRAMGRAAAKPAILERFVELVRHKGVLGLANAEIVRAMGSVAATDQFLEQLAELLRDDDPDIRKSAARVAGRIGGAAANPAILERIAELLGDVLSVRVAAAEAVARMGSGAATPTIIEGLDKMLLGELDTAEPRLLPPGSTAAAVALRRIGGAAASRAIPKLIALVGHEDDPLRASAIQILGQMEMAATVRGDAAQAVQKIGSGTATDELLERIVELAHNEAGSVRALVLLFVNMMTYFYCHFSSVGGTLSLGGGFFNAEAKPVCCRTYPAGATRTGISSPQIYVTV